MADFWENPCFPACYVEFPAYTAGYRAAFFLAAEEYVAKNFPEDHYFFTWQLSPTVVMGRNQVAHQEINMDFCRKNRIDIIRRRSGGGTIFADEGNIMLSLVTGAGKVEPLFMQYALAEVKALRSLGAQVSISGRNDVILVDHGKICGNAFYHLWDRNIIHGTMLYDTDPELMHGALTPDVSKLQAKGVKSVRARVGLLKDALSLGVKELREELRRLLTDRTITLTDSQIRQIQELEQAYYEPAFLYGSTPGSGFCQKERIEGCGTVEVTLQLKGSTIRQVELRGDFFELEPLDGILDQALRGKPLTRETIREALRQTDLSRYIRNLTNEQFISLIFKNL